LEKTNGGEVICMLLVGKPEGNRLGGRPRHRWVDNIKMVLEEIGWSGMDWIPLAQDKDKWRALLNALFSSITCWEFL
jgi:hypothetical protein